MIIQNNGGGEAKISVYSDLQNFSKYWKHIASESSQEDFPR